MIQRSHLTVHGHLAPGFEGVGAAMVANVVEHGEVGAAVCAHVDGEVGVDCWIGHRGAARTEPWRRSPPPTATPPPAVWPPSTEGLLDGRLLSEDLLAEATRPQSSGWCPTLAQDVTFGLGFQPWTEGRPLGRTAGGYGHFGTGGSLGFADPARRIAFGYVMNHVIHRWQSPRNGAVVDALYAALG